MADKSEVYDYKDFNYWFVKVPETYGKDCPIFNVIVKKKDHNNYGEKVGIIQEAGLEYNQYNLKLINAVAAKHSVGEIKADFDRYLHTKSVATLGDIFDIDSMSDKDLIMTYDLLLAGAMFYRKYSKSELDSDIESSVNATVKRNLDWLHSTDFYVCPASTKYHDAVDGGLLRHTLAVYNNMIDLFKLKKFKNVNLGSAVLVALIHDWCKIGLYSSYMRNVKDDATGTWRKEKAFQYNVENLPVPGGHGATSMFYAVRMFNVDIEEAMAIRWHMGEYNVADNESGEMHECNERYPLVFMIQFADRLAITKF